jgi:outer membrane protein TolC
MAQQQLLVQAEGMAQQIELEQKNAWLQLQSLQQQIQYLETEILPTLITQQNLLRRSYQLGEINYLNVLQSLEQILATRQQHLELLLKLNLQLIDYQYYSN